MTIHAFKMQLKPGGARAYTPKDLELFQASAFQQKSCYKGYDKITISPAHQYLPESTIRPSRGTTPSYVNFASRRV